MLLRFFLITLLLFFACMSQSSGAAAKWFERSYALVVGINSYGHSAWPRLPYAEKDAQAMKSFLEGQSYEVISLLGNQATRNNILEALGIGIAPRVTNRDRVVIYFSGHGESREVGWRDFGYIIPYDANQHFATWISMSEVREISEQMERAKHLLIIFDSCYGGAIGRKSKLFGGTQSPRYIQKISGNRARQFLAAGGRNEAVLDSGPYGYSYFTGFLLKGLAGGADLDSDTYVTMGELSAFMLQAASNWGQTPTWGSLPGHEQGEFWFRVPGTRGAAEAVPFPAIPIPSPYAVKGGRPSYRPNPLHSSTLRAISTN